MDNLLTYAVNQCATTDCFSSVNLSALFTFNHKEIK